jgi:hypothetical protein
MIATITPGKMDELAVLRSLAEAQLRYDRKLRALRGEAVTGGVIVQDHEIRELATERDMLLELWRRAYRERPVTFLDAARARAAGAV